MAIWKVGSLTINSLKNHLNDILKSKINFDWLDWYIKVNIYIWDHTIIIESFLFGWKMKKL
jgi:hypothetical protein